jgi:small multidrug resistance family-3 protein
MTQTLQAVLFLIAATILEVSGDAVIRIALHNHAGLGPARIGLFVLGGILVFSYGSLLNMATLEFR